jgi:iron uptake system component EfeO
MMIAAACSSSSDTEATKLSVAATEYAFAPATLTAPAGDIVFSVRNDGKEEHEFEIFKGTEVVDEVEDIAPGLSRDLSVKLDAGSYEYICKLPGHDEKGMKGTLTVT